MCEKGLTNISLKKINKSKVYQYIYRKKTTSKLQIVQELQMGLSTVSQNLNLLEQEGLIKKNGFFESTGGRKANALQIVSDFKISIGIGILKGMFHITAVDLYGNAFYTDTIPLPYSNTPDYYKQVTDAVKEFISSRQYDNDKVLGISIATQGITSPDHTSVLYGDIMNNAGMKLDDFSRYLPYPCYLEHDSKSAAFLELWNHPELDSAVIILLNRNLGGGIITNHQIHQGISMHSGTLEHMCINPDGPLCYCGSRGCLETYCSANALEQAASMPAKEFFPLLREKKSPQIIQIWKDYLNHLAAERNSRCFAWIQFCIPQKRAVFVRSCGNHNSSEMEVFAYDEKFRENRCIGASAPQAREALASARLAFVPDAADSNCLVHSVLLQADGGASNRFPEVQHVQSRQEQVD